MARAVWTERHDDTERQGVIQIEMAIPASSWLLNLRNKPDRAHEVVVTSWSQAL